MDMIFDEEFFDSLDLSTPIVMTVDDGSLLTTKHNVSLKILSILILYNETLMLRTQD